MAAHRMRFTIHLPSPWRRGQGRPLLVLHSATKMMMAGPAGARRWQTRMLALVLLLLPIFLQMGPVPLIFTVLLSCALYASTIEVVVACALLVFLAASPLASSATSSTRPRVIPPRQYLPLDVHTSPLRMIKKWVELHVATKP